MQGNTTYRKKVVRYSYLKLIGSSALVSIICCLLAYSLKHSTGYVQEELFERVFSWNPKLFIILPSIGITAIYFLR